MTCAPRTTVGLAVLLTACSGGGQRGPSGAPDALTLDAYPTRLIRPADIDGDFALEQEVTITHAEGENGFRAVLQKRGDELLLVGLGPHGGRAFSLAQHGVETSYESYVPIELPFPPEFMLYDVHRTWFVASASPDLARDTEGDAPSEHTFERAGERIHERWREGRLVERTFERLDGDPAGAIVVRYADGLATGAPSRVAPPAEATLDNRWFGYSIRVRTLSWTPIE